MRGGHRDGGKIPEYDYKSMKVHSVLFTKMDVSVDVTVTLKNGKDIITVDIDSTTDRFKSIKQTMQGVVANVDEKLSARAQKPLRRALVAAYKKHGRSDEADEDEDKWHRIGSALRLGVRRSHARIT